MSLSRSKPMSRGTSQLARTGFKPAAKPAEKRESANENQPEKPRKKMKSRGLKMTPIRKAARGQDCTLRIPGVCNYNPETTVLCHSPYLDSGRGMGLKAPDTEACFGCHSCHGILDRRDPWPSWMTEFKMEGAFIRARNATHVILKKMGLLP